MIGKFESNKDLIQELTVSGAKRVGNIASIITGTVGAVTREIGDWMTDAIEMREAAAAAKRDAEAQRAEEAADVAPQPAAAAPVPKPESSILDAEVVDHPGDGVR
ncbi:hypothetical protein [Nocardia asteroides]|uniref:hypothetical protein n=1 Tax=Nocardia asteroides TaxID=1824 RepID=UPI001E45E981|nr:hypothetical protein [Nocardia asteroides]UGT60403.1 hypothetical protein LTT61_24905 [Nocardia asteroides]